jgi:hypothetical protein
VPVPQLGVVDGLIATSSALLFNVNELVGFGDQVYGYRADTGMNATGPGGNVLLIRPTVFRDEVCSVMADSLYCLDGTPAGVRKIGPDQIGSFSDPVILGDKLYFRACGYFDDLCYSVWVTDGNSPARPLGGDAVNLTLHAGAIYGSCYDSTAGHGWLCRFLDGVPVELLDASGSRVFGMGSIPGTPLLAFSASAPCGRRRVCRDSEDYQLRVYNASSGGVEHIVINPTGSARADRFFPVEE